MNKKIALLAICTIALLGYVQPTQALTVIINDNGTMQVREGRVLGDDTEQEDEQENESENESQQKQEEEKKESEDRSEDKSAETQREAAKQEAERVRETSKQVFEKKREAAKKVQEKVTEKKAALKEIKSIKTQENKQLKVKNKEQSTEVTIEDKELDDSESSYFRNLEKLDAQDVDIELPAGSEIGREDTEKSLDDSAEVENEQIKRVKAERRARNDTLEIKTQTNDNGEQEIEIESGTIKAKLNVAEFVVDPSTKDVVVTTKNGETHTLVHLPDQALLQMEFAGLLNADDTLAKSNLSIETREDGTVVYKTKRIDKRRLFGFIPFEVEDEVELNDTDSTVTVEPTDTSMFGKLLMNLSV